VSLVLELNDAALCLHRSDGPVYQQPAIALIGADGPVFGAKALQAARLQRIAAKRHGQGEYELNHQRPARDEGAGDEQDDGIQDQEGDNCQLVPVRRMAEEVLPEGICGVYGVLLKLSRMGCFRPAMAHRRPRLPWGVSLVDLPMVGKGAGRQAPERTVEPAVPAGLAWTVAWNALKQ